MNTKDFVEQILKENEKARNDDFVLCLNVYIKMGFARTIPTGVIIEYKNIESAPSFETITRIRREIQNEEGRLIPNEETEKKRKKNQDEIYKYYSGKNKSYDTMKNSWMS